MPSPGITKKAIASAMKELMAERSFAKISIGDIVARCELNRNSFYYHFKDKFDLVNWIFYTELANEVSREDVLKLTSWAVIDQLCAFLYKDKGFYINALSVSGQNSFEEYYLDTLKMLVRTRTQDLFDDDKHRDFFVDFFAEAFCAATLNWLRGGARIPPEEFSELIKKAATGAAVRILENSTPD